MKKLLCLLLACVMSLSLFSACGAEKAPATEPAPTEPEEEAKVLKVLTLGSSSSVDSNHMINLVATAEGAEQEILIGTLYYSGCKLPEHVKFLQQNAPEYRLYLSSTATPDQPPQIMDDVTMEMALRFDYWDIIVMQASSFETQNEECFTNGNIQIIQNYVNEKKLNPNAYFAWHFTGVPATDPDLQSQYPYSPNPYIDHMARYGNDRVKFFEPRVANIGKYIFTDETFKFVICSGTATMNASSSYLTEKDLIRDYTHATDLARVILSYMWYAKLAGIEEFAEIKLDAVPRAFLKSAQDKSKDRPITEDEKAIILESVNNALKDPLHITQSQYTEAPVQP